MRIKDLMADEKPREKLLSHGPSVLSNVELLAILLSSGTPQKNAIEVSRELLELCGGSIAGLSSMGMGDMMEIDGIGKAKASTLCAAIELGRRFCQDRPDSTQYTSASMVYDLMSPVLKGLDHEECWCLYLTRSCILLGREKLSSGGPQSTVIDPIQIVRKAIARKASSVIVIHNHPSGSPIPGDADKRETMKLKAALAKAEISLTDHVIISDGSYFSFAEGREFRKS